MNRIRKIISVVTLIGFIFSNISYAIPAKHTSFALRPLLQMDDDNFAEEVQAALSDNGSGKGKGSLLGLMNTMLEQGIKAGDKITALGTKPHRIHKTGLKAGEEYGRTIVYQEFRDAVTVGILIPTGTKDEHGRNEYIVAVTFTQEILDLLESQGLSEIFDLWRLPDDDKEIAKVKSAIAIIKNVMASKVEEVNKSEVAKALIKIATDKFLSYGDLASLKTGLEQDPSLSVGIAREMMMSDKRAADENRNLLMAWIVDSERGLPEGEIGTFPVQLLQFAMYPEHPEIWEEFFEVPTYDLERTTISVKRRLRRLGMAYPVVSPMLNIERALLDIIIEGSPIDLQMASAMPSSEAGVLLIDSRLIPFFYSDMTEKSILFKYLVIIKKMFENDRDLRINIAMPSGTTHSTIWSRIEGVSEYVYVSLKQAEEEGRFNFIGREQVAVEEDAPVIAIDTQKIYDAADFSYILSEPETFIDFIDSMRLISHILDAKRYKRMMEIAQRRLELASGDRVTVYRDASTAETNKIKRQFRIVPTKKIIPHEFTSKQNVKPIRKSIRETGRFHMPGTISRVILPDGRVVYMKDDCHNRAEAAEEEDMEAFPAQVVDYFSEEVILFQWLRVWTGVEIDEFRDMAIRLGLVEVKEKDAFISDTQGPVFIYRHNGETMRFKYIQEPENAKEAFKPLNPIEKGLRDQGRFIKDLPTVIDAGFIKEIDNQGERAYFVAWTIDLVNIENNKLPEGSLICIPPRVEKEDEKQAAIDIYMAGQEGRDPKEEVLAWKSEAHYLEPRIVGPAAIVDLLESYDPELQKILDRDLEKVRWYIADGARIEGRPYPDIIAVPWVDKGVELELLDGEAIRAFAYRNNVFLETLNPNFEPALQRAEMSEAHIQLLLNTAVMHGLSSGKVLSEDNGSNFDMQAALARHTEVAKALVEFIEARLRLAAAMPGSNKTGILREEVNTNRDLAEALIIANAGEDREILEEYLKICDAIVASNFLSWRYDGFDPPVLIFDGSKLPKGEHRHDIYRVAIVPDRTGSFTIIIKTDPVSAGGIRVYLAEETVALNHLFEEGAGLSDGMASKDFWAGIPYGGSKGENVLVRGANREKVLSRAAVSLANIIGDGGFWSGNIGGPDVNAGGLQKAVDATRKEYKTNNIQEEILFLVERLGSVGMMELAEQGRDSLRKRLALYNLEDPALTRWHELLSDKVILHDEFSWAMREEVLQAIREGRISEANGWRLSKEKKRRTDKILNKILGVLIGGGSLKKGSLVADKDLQYITAMGNAREFIHLVRHFLNIGRIEKGHKIRIAITGAGAVGGGMIVELIDYINKELGGDAEVIVVAVVEHGIESSGVIYKEEGFTKDDRDAFKRVLENPDGSMNRGAVENGYTLAVAKGLEGVIIRETPKGGDPRDVLLDLLDEKDDTLDILFAAAKGPTVTMENVDRYAKRFSLAIIAGENSCFGTDAATIAEVEQALHDEGVIGLEGYIGNFGTVYAVCGVEGRLKHMYSLKELKAGWDEFKKGTTVGLFDLIDERIPYLLEESERRGVPPGHVQVEMVNAIREEAYAILDRYEREEPGQETADAINELILSWREPKDGSPKSYMPYSVAKMMAAMKLARKAVLVAK